MKYDVVIAVDANHLEHLKLVWPTWKRHKPSLFKNRIIVIYDSQSVTVKDITNVIGIQKPDDVQFRPWPPLGVEYEHDPTSRFGNGQRYKMLSAFVHQAWYDRPCDYWLKLDLDVVATGNDDWVNEDWFKDKPAIVASGWGYTKPADQMLKLDQWVVDHDDKLKVIAQYPPLNLVPESGSGLVRHSRIISWCGFFNVGFSAFCAGIAKRTVGYAKLPVPSQDGYHFYVAERCKLPIVRVRMKDFGWQHCSNIKVVRSAVEKAMA